MPNLVPSRGSAPAITAAGLPALGSGEPDAITLGRVMQPGVGIANKMMYGGDRGVMVFGPNGTGKSTRLFIPNLLQMSGSSVVVVDPKGELAAVTAPYRRTLGPVVVINPFGVLTDWRGYDDLRSAGFNPLARLDPAAASFNVDAALLADAMIKVGGKDPHWDESARSLIAWLIMYVVIEARELRRVPTFARVRELLCLPSSFSEKDGPKGLPALAEAAMGYGLPGLSNKASQFTDWNDEIQSITSAAKRQTESFDDPEIAADLAKNGFDFRELKRRPITVYLILPPDMMARHSKWLRLVLTAAIQSVLRVRQPGEPKTLFMLDEFFSLGHLEIISTVWALVRGYGVLMMPVLQSLGQLKALYPELWETMIGMAGATASFTPNEMTTADYLSRRAGETTRSLMSYNQGSGSNLGPGGASASNNSGMSYSAVKVPLITPHQMLGMRDGYMQVTLAGLQHTIPTYAPYYKDIDTCRARARPNPYD